MTTSSRLSTFVVAFAVCNACSSDPNSRPPDAGIDLSEPKDVGSPEVAGGDAIDGNGVGFPDATVGMGGACQVNADCADSPAADALKNVRCAGAELYCWMGTCYADCMESCTVVRTDVNPCPSPRICEPRLGGSQSFCAMIPAKCQTAADCPAYLPPADGGMESWSCQTGACTYPGYAFPTK